MQLNTNLYYVGIQDFDLRVFDIIMETRFGTSYNSYLLKTAAGDVLFETAKAKFFDEYLENIKAYTTLDQIKYVVCSHTEPDHVGSLERLLELCPEITVISSPVAANYLKEIVNHPFQSKTVKDNEIIEIGQYHFQFLSVPNLHWPDTMYTYIQELKTLVTCDSFGAHYATHHLLLSKVENQDDYQEAFLYYTKMILSPFKPFLLKAMHKLDGMEIEMILPGHGPVIDTNIQGMIEAYKKYCEPVGNETTSVVIPYVSCYGYTETMAKVLKEVMEANQLQCEMYDLVSADMNQVITACQSADGILYGCPTLLNDALPPIYHVMNEILMPYYGAKIVSAFGSYGWTGEAVGNMLVRLKQMKHKVVDEGYRCKFKPSDTQLAELRAYGENFAKHVIEGK